MKEPLVLLLRLFMLYVLFCGVLLYIRLLICERSLVDAEGSVLVIVGTDSFCSVYFNNVRCQMILA